MAYESVKRDLRRAYDQRADMRDAMADAAWKQPERARFRDALRQAGAVTLLAAGGLFYWGQYGGHDFEGVYAEDDYEPKRFFSRLTDEQIQRHATRAFEIVDFHTIPLDGPGWSYQALILRRP